MLAITKAVIYLVGLLLIAVIFQHSLPAVLFVSMALTWWMFASPTKRPETRRYVGKSRTRNP